MVKLVKMKNRQGRQKNGKADNRDKTVKWQGRGGAYFRALSSPNSMDRLSSKKITSHKQTNQQTQQKKHLARNRRAGQKKNSPIGGTTGGSSIGTPDRICRDSSKSVALAAGRAKSADLVQIGKINGSPIFPPRVFIWRDPLLRRAAY